MFTDRNGRPCQAWDDSLVAAMFRWCQGAWRRLLCSPTRTRASRSCTTDCLSTAARNSQSQWSRVRKQQRKMIQWMLMRWVKESLQEKARKALAAKERAAKNKTTCTSAGTAARWVTMPVTAVSGGGQEAKAKVDQKQVRKVTNMLMDGLRGDEHVDGLWKTSEWWDESKRLDTMGIRRANGRNWVQQYWRMLQREPQKGWKAESERKSQAQKGYADTQTVANTETHAVARREQCDEWDGCEFGRKLDEELLRDGAVVCIADRRRDEANKSKIETEFVWWELGERKRSLPGWGQITEASTGVHDGAQRGCASAPDCGDGRVKEVKRLSRETEFPIATNWPSCNGCDVSYWMWSGRHRGVCLGTLPWRKDTTSKRHWDDATTSVSCLQQFIDCNSLLLQFPVTLTPEV